MSTRMNLNIFLRDPRARAVAMCLDALVRMDPGAVTAHKLRPCSDEEFDNAVKAAAKFLWGANQKTWPADVNTVLNRERTHA